MPEGGRLPSACRRSKPLFFYCFVYHWSAAAGHAARNAVISLSGARQLNSTHGRPRGERGVAPAFKMAARSRRIVSIRGSRRIFHAFRTVPRRMKSRRAQQIPLPPLKIKNILGLYRYGEFQRSVYLNGRPFFLERNGKTRPGAARSRDSTIRFMAWRCARCVPPFRLPEPINGTRPTAVPRFATTETVKCRSRFERVLQRRRVRTISIPL